MTEKVVKVINPPDDDFSVGAGTQKPGEGVVGRATEDIDRNTNGYVVFDMRGTTRVFRAKAREDIERNDNVRVTKDEELLVEKLGDRAPVPNEGVPKERVVFEEFNVSVPDDEDILDENIKPRLDGAKLQVYIVPEVDITFHLRRYIGGGSPDKDFFNKNNQLKANASYIFDTLVSDDNELNFGGNSGAGSFGVRSIVVKEIQEANKL